MPLSTDAPPRRLGPEARALAERFWPYCVRYSRLFGAKYPQKPLDWEGAAAVALCEAALGFDPSRGEEATRDKQFQAYLGPRLRGAMVDLIRESACRGYRFKQERQRHGDGPRLFSFHAPEQPLSASAVLFTYEEQPIGWEVDSADVVENLACRLPPIHNTAIRVLYLHAGASTHLQAGRVMGVSESRVGQVHREALRWLRGPIT